MAPRAGLEPATNWLTVNCSTNWATEELDQDTFFYKQNNKNFGGHAQNRTGIEGFAILCVTIPPRGQIYNKNWLNQFFVLNQIIICLGKMQNSNYNHINIENKIYEYWEKNKFFKPKKNKKKHFSIVIPPPNVTGSLHMGHALNNSLQDLLVRFYRMNDY